MPTTPNHALPYPDAADDANVPGDLQALATAADTAIELVQDALETLAGDVVSVVTSLPGSPSNGDEVILVDSLTAPTYAWRLIYLSGISDANKWLFIGGVPLLSEVTGAIGQGGGSGQGDLSGGPSVSIPRAGVYDIEFGAHMGMNNGNAITYLVVNGVTISQQAESTSGSGSAWSLARYTAASAGLVAKLQYSNAASSSATFEQRKIVIRPVRIA